MSEQKHEPVPFRTFIQVWICLLILTVTTVIVSRIHLGPWNIWAALGIASLKSSLVIFFFMHLRHEMRLFKIGLLVLLVIVAIFIGVTFFDVLYR
ncbi:cytochrome C oxidase subunit IV family protein [Geopsychrobacter electrodiphilus]|uniref:cytochrome C oxidase subunit IV family protein n=1 Tax=Geopsychrobacter electrodiphilus TaxID=225196 RepID=UPI0003801925|nr:cytochrome C oxidase subunit IV family protein [Geopsychrobacter electrodiphilus]